MRTAFAFLLFLAASSVSAQIQLDSGLRGTWWNAGRSGEGLQLDLTRLDSQNSLILFWYTYDLNGNQVYLFGSAPHVSTNTSVTFSMVSTRGGQFGAGFDPLLVQRPSWGTVTLTFSTCSAGNLHYESPSLGMGDIPIVRFGTLVTHTCTAVTPGATYTYPYIKGDWIAQRSVDAITSAVTCQLYARKQGVEFIGQVAIFRRVGGNVYFSALISGPSTVFTLDSSRSAIRVDDHPSWVLSQITSNAPTLAGTGGFFGQLVGEMMTGRNMVVRMVAQNQFVAVHEINYPLTFFPQVRAAFDACVAGLPN